MLLLCFFVSRCKFILLWRENLAQPCKTDQSAFIDADPALSCLTKQAYNKSIGYSVVGVGQKSSLSGSHAAVKCPKIIQHIMQHKIMNAFSVKPAQKSFVWMHLYLLASYQKWIRRNSWGPWPTINVVKLFFSLSLAKRPNNIQPRRTLQLIWLTSL
jgi:hypothetical protein